VRAGASGKRESQCDNLKNNVNFVALVTIRRFVLGTVTADRNNNQIDIEALTTLHPANVSIKDQEPRYHVSRP